MSTNSTILDEDLSPLRAHKAEIRITDFGFRQGYLPPKAMTLVIEWAIKHKEELLEEWNTARKQKPLFPIEPLL